MSPPLPSSLTARCHEVVAIPLRAGLGAAPRIYTNTVIACARREAFLPTKKSRRANLFYRGGFAPSTPVRILL